MTSLGLSPTLVRALVPHGDPASDLSSLRTFVTTGEPWNPEPYRWLFETVGRGRVPVINVSGGTLQLATGGGNNRVIVAPTPTITGGAIDLTENKMIVTTAGATGTWDPVAGAYNGVSGMVASGRNGGAWNGSGIITSSASPTSNLMTLGVAKIGDIKQIADTDTTTVAGQTVHGSDTLVMYTYGGDANLDGKINIDDYGRIDGNVGQSGTVFGWYNGDFNYDGKINIDDYGIIDGNIGAQGAPIDTSGAPLAGVAVVPEPGSLALLGLLAPVVMRRRRRA